MDLIPTVPFCHLGLDAVTRVRLSLEAEELILSREMLTYAELKLGRISEKAVSPCLSPTL